MEIGLKSDIVYLADHSPQWAKIAAETINKLWSILGEVAVDIQHVGSTAIPSIKAKPIIDIAVAVREFADFEPYISALENGGFSYRGWFLANRITVLNVYESPKLGERLTTCHVHIVKVDSDDWKNHINFRDYMNSHPVDAKEYEVLKIRLADENPIDPNREKYNAGKEELINNKLKLARIWDNLGRRYAKIEPISKGWSGDKKYYIETTYGQKLLLRIADIAEYERKKIEYNALKKASELDEYIPQPCGFGVCNAGSNVYYLTTWLEGEDAASVMSGMSSVERYALGIKAGELLRKLHTLPAPSDAEPWQIRFQRKIDERLAQYHENKGQTKNGEIVIKYLNDNAYLLKKRTQTFNHGDFNTTNLIVSSTGKVGVIDFNAFFMTEGAYSFSDFGDPLFEMVAISYMETPDPYYYTGLWNGYSGGKPDDDFFKMTAFYFAYDVLTSLGGNESFDNGGFDKKTLAWYDNFNRTIPSWYMQGIELMDIYDAQRNKTGRYWIRGSQRDKDDYILIAAALLRRSDGRYLLTKRSPNKGDANKWNIQGGASLAGEDSLSAAIRENAEECGIVPDASRAELFMSQMKDTAFMDIWLFRQDFSLDDIILRDDETCDAMAATLDEIIALNSCGGFTNGTVIPAGELIAKIKEWEAAR